MVYGIFTAGQRTWGGPRADAAQADATTSPQDAIAYAEATGNDLNIVPETFRPAVEAMNLGRDHATFRVPLQPASNLGGRFRMSGSSEEMASLRSVPVGDIIQLPQRVRQ